jgi:ABC-2 type transport system ATP-binding protein
VTEETVMQTGVADDAVVLEAVVKRFDAVTAVDALDLRIPRGTTCGFIGPSGAGKTTAIRLILSILLPDAGRLAVLGQQDAMEAKDRIGYLPEERGVYRKMRVDAFLQYMARLKGVPPEIARERSLHLLGQVGLADSATKRCEDLSKGMLQRVQFVAAIVHEPDLLILDEPFSGLDPVSVQMLRGLIVEQQRRGATILFSTHVMANAEALCDHIVMIHKGRKVLDEPMSTLRRQYDLSRIHVEPLDAAADLSVLAGVEGVASLQRTAEGCDLQLAAGVRPETVMQQVAARVPPARIEIARIRLEDVFIGLVTQEGGAESLQALRSHLQGQAQGAAA